VAIWYIFPFLVFCTKKNLATLLTATAAVVIFESLAIDLRLFAHPKGESCEIPGLNPDIRFEGKS
jgi:hypothetical protein